MKGSFTKCRQNLRQAARGATALCALLLSSHWAQATIYTVTTTDTNRLTTGTLPWAVAQVNAGTGGDEIHFNIPGGGIHTIPSYTDMNLSRSVIVDGTTQPGYVNAPLINIAGNGDYYGGFVVDTGSSSFKGLSFSGLWAALRLNTDGNTVTRCYVGTVSGFVAAGNASGIIIQGSNNVIGGINEGNVISANTYNGIGINSGSNNVVKGNIIGLDASGTTAMGNTSDAINIGYPGPTATIIGGSASGERNIISGNKNGIVATLGTTSIKGNYIGTDITGTIAIGNTDYGVSAYAEANIGGTGVGESNIISGNTMTGILVSGNYYIVVEGNRIGLDANGAALPNKIGIYISGGNNAMIGGTGTARNYISGNTTYGIYSSTSSFFTIKNNYIGTNIAGTAAVGNGSSGININGSGPRIEGNLISGNRGRGIDLPSGLSTSVISNIIGLDATGTFAIPNMGYGIYCAGYQNYIGNGLSGGGNVISGHDSAGIFLDGYGHVVRGNYIGTNKAGTAAIPNRVGIFSPNAEGYKASIGGSRAYEGNLISGNTNNGIHLTQCSSTGIKGNIIGLDVNGNPLGNGGHGILLDGDTSDDTIGDDTTSARNYISGNGGSGLYITGNIYNIKIKGNYIGTDLSGNVARGNSGYGIYFRGNSITIGGSAAGEGNIVSGNSLTGIFIKPTWGGNMKGNIIGMDAAVTSFIGNGGSGIVVDSASYYTVGGSAAGEGNTIAGNGGDGVTVLSGSKSTVISRNSIFNNGGLGIDLANDGPGQNDAGDIDYGANGLVNFPVITSVVQAGGNTTIAGTYDGYANNNYRIELFNNTTSNASGYGEGKTYIGGANITTNGSAHGTFSVLIPGTYGIISATATNVDSFTTSEFSMTGPVFTTVISPTVTLCYTGGSIDLKSLVHVSDVMADQTLTWSQSSAPANGSLTISSATAASGNADITPGGVIAYTPTSGYSGADAFTIQVSDGSAVSTITINMNINVAPSITATGGGTVCAGATLNLSSTVTPGAGTVVYSWSGPDAFSSSSANPSIPSATTDAAGTYTLIATDNTNGCADTATTSVTINATPAISAADNHGPICANGTMELTSAASGGTGTLSYAWSGPNSFNQSGNNQTIAGVTTAASGTYTLIVTDVNNCADTATTTATIYPMPVISAISNNAPVCEDNTLNLYSTVTGGTTSYNYTWWGPNKFYSDDENPTVTSAASATHDGIYTLIVTDANNCSDTGSTSVTVFPIKPITGNDTVTFGLTTTLSEAVTGGTWSTPTPWITKVTAGTGDVKGVSAGISQISYTTAAGCVATYTVTVKSGNNACVGQSITISDGLASGGTWTSSNNSVASVVINTGVITGVAAGNVIITHKLATGAMTTTTVKVNPLAVIIATPANVCQGQTLMVGNTTAGGGTWYSGNTATAVISAGGSVLGIAGGTATIYFTPNSGCATTKTITITPVTPITGPTSVCAGQTVTLTNTAGGGTWSTSNASMASVSGGTVGGVNAGTPIISYKWPSGCFATAAITVKPLAVIGGGAATLCLNTTMTLTNTTTGGGTWSADNKFSVTGGGIVTGLATGAGNIYFNANNGCVATKTATVLQSPVIGGITNVCAGQTTLLSSSMTGGTWSTNNGSMATVYNGIVTGVAASTPTISYKMPTGCFGAAAVTVKALSQISGGSTSICPSGTTTYTNATPGGGAWSSSVPSVANISGSGFVTGSGAAAGSKTVISFTSTANACVATRTVTIVACRDGGNTTETESIATPAVFNVQLYPNPNKGFFTLKGTIDMAAGDEANIEVVNMLGQVIYRSKAYIQNGNIEEQVQLQGNLASGTYILNLRTTSGNKLFHFVVGQ